MPRPDRGVVGVRLLLGVGVWLRHAWESASDESPVPSSAVCRVCKKARLRPRRHARSVDSDKARLLYDYTLGSPLLYCSVLYDLLSTVYFTSRLGEVVRRVFKKAHLRPRRPAQSVDGGEVARGRARTWLKGASRRHAAGGRGRACWRHARPPSKCGGPWGGALLEV